MICEVLHSGTLTEFLIKNIIKHNTCIFVHEKQYLYVDEV